MRVLPAGVQSRSPYNHGMITHPWYLYVCGHEDPSCHFIPLVGPLLVELEREMGMFQ